MGQWGVAMRWLFSPHVARILWCVCLIALGVAGQAPLASSAEAPRRIFLLEGLEPSLPASVETVAAFKKRLKQRTSANLEVFTDFLDLGRFRGPDADTRLVQYLKSKFTEARPDLIISISRGATYFLAQHRAEIAAGIPTAYCCTPISPADRVDLPRGMPGIRIDYDWVTTFKLAQSLQPDARTVVFVSGNSVLGRAWQNDAVLQLKAFLPKYQVQYLIGGHDEILEQMRHLTRDSIVLLMPIFGGNFGAPSEAASDFAGASAAPAYSPVSTLFGGGILGGNIASYSEQGKTVADLALDILSGKHPATLPAQTEQIKLPPELRVDARQLERWGMSENLLPPGTKVEFRSPTLWQEHRSPIILFVAAMLVQVSIIALLLIQRRKRRAAESLLKESEDRMAFGAAASNIGFWRLDTKSGGMWATEHCRLMFGIAPGIPMSWELFRDAVQAEDRTIFDEVLLSPAEMEFSRGKEFRIEVREKGLRWYMARYRTEYGPEEGSVRISGLFVDVTARKSAELEADGQRKELTHMMRVAALGELSGGLAHELSQPLAAILANAQAAQALLAQKPRDEELLSEILHDIVQEDFRAGQVVHRLRRLLKRGEQQLAPTSLNDLISSTLGLLHSELVGRKIRVETELDGGLPLVSGDPVQLQQVLLNLMMNAMEAMTNTPAQKRLLSIVTRMAKDGCIEARITDRGPGIGSNELARLFEPFFTTKGHGLGLGLSICSTIIQSHRGQLSISNAPGEGAVAVLRLPVRLELAEAS
jgi:C4-dicarboxylate-specific signal transduction histidine kinase